MSGTNVLDINDLNFETEVLESKEPFVLDFGSRWCPPCRALGPVIERLADERMGQLRVGKLDTDDSPGVASRFRIRGVPTIVVFRDGREVARHVGFTSHQRLMALAAIT